jgi:alkylation response protein AidB-like acyl-CoA dehydrogenase
MDFSLTDDQMTERARARAFAAETLAVDLADRDARGAVDPSDWRHLWTAAADFGLFGLIVPPAYGGSGTDLVTTIVILEAIGYGCRDNGLTLGINGQLWSIMSPILAFGTEAQKQRWLPAMVRGEVIGAHGMTEAESGSDALSMATTARRDGDHWVLDGEKIYVGMAPACDMAIVFASTRPDRGAWGVSAFLVDAATPGFIKAGQQQKMGVRTAPMGRIVLDGCRVPDTARLGPEGAGNAIFQHSMEWERRFIFTSHVGAMQRQLDECLAFADGRKVFGKPIAGHQSVANRLAEMKLRLETSQLLLYKAAWAMAGGHGSTLDAALVKLHVSEAFVASSLDAIRIHGGRGYLSEAGVERDLRDAVGGVIYAGTSDIQRQVIARLLDR